MDYGEYEEQSSRGNKSPDKDDNESDPGPETDNQIEIPVSPANVVEIDEEERLPERGGWASQIQFILTCIGYLVGLGNIWRFPYLVYKHGGGTFLIPYVLMLITLGVPSFFLECSLGQFSVQGPLTCWSFAQLFRGVGIAQLGVSFLISTYYNVIMAWSLYYLYKSFAAELPWTKCSDPWMTNECRNLKSFCDDTKSGSGSGNTVNTSYMARIRSMFAKNDNYIECGGCGYIVKVFTCRHANFTLSGFEYLDNHITGTREELAEGLSGLGHIKWPMFVCLLLCWIIIALCMSQGTTSVGRSSYVTALAPYFFLTVLLFNALSKDGALNGIKYYVTPVPEKLLNIAVWKDAAVQIFFTLSVAMGGLIALSSYNKFHNNILNDTAIVIIGNCSTSIFAGFVVFAYIGYISHEQGVEVPQFAEEDERRRARSNLLTNRR